ncbi:sensor histidine kinase [Sphingosinicellaceae bacterium]|nr:sensor histidine kinase [Sphingosinicellaceae bacterium]
MLAEQAHRTANDLSVVMAALHLAKTRPREGADRLETAMNQVMALAAAQRLLIPPMASCRRDVGDLVERVCRQISLARLAPNGIDLHVAADACIMDATTAWAVAAIIAELLNNAARHAFKDRTGTVRVELRYRNDFLIARVVDDGVGSGRRPDMRQVRAGSGAGVGSSIVHALARSVDATFERSASPDGTTAEFWLHVERSSLCA